MSPQLLVSLALGERWLVSSCQGKIGEPVSKDRFNILVRTGERTSRNSTTRGIGMGSKKQDF